jgi:putative N-acetylmannosamine-6-phosphate epimerase
LEEVEEISNVQQECFFASVLIFCAVFNLINNVDVQATNEKIDKFRQENQNLIAINNSKQQRELKAELFQLEQEKSERKMMRDAFAKKEREDIEAKKNQKEMLLAELVQKASKVCARVLTFCSRLLQPNQLVTY